MCKIRTKKINYVLIDTRNNYEIDEKNDNKNLNTYNNSDASVVNIYCDGYIGSSGTNNISYTIRPITCIPTSVFNEKYLSSLVNKIENSKICFASWILPYIKIFFHFIYINS